MPGAARRVLWTSASSVFILMLSTACGSGTESGGTPATALKAAPAAERLDGVCPKTVVVQSDWEPEGEHGALYNLVGPGYTVDSAKKRVTGPLVVDGRDTGVRIEIRAGGSAIGYQSVPSQMYIDKSITLGMTLTDAAIAAAAKQPVTGVATLLKKSPQILMWDPKTHPDWKTIADIGKSDAKVVFVNGSTFAQLLVEKGLIKKSQLDGSYDGSPSRFASDPSIAQQGYATAEPYIYQHEVRAWGKPIAYQLLADVGYSVYESLSARSGEVDRIGSCLKKLVPVIQKSEVDFAAHPDHAIDVIEEAVTKYNTGWVYSRGTGDFAAQQMVKLGVVGNEADGSIGGFDMARVKQTLSTFAPLIADSGATIPAGLTADKLATNQFVDRSIGMR